MLKQGEKLQKGRIKPFRLGNFHEGIFFRADQESAFQKGAGPGTAETDEAVMARLPGRRTIGVGAVRFGNEGAGTFRDLLRLAVHAEEETSGMVVLNPVISLEDPVSGQRGIVGILP